jgi:dihydroorotate dehydrogenase
MSIHRHRREHTLIYRLFFKLFLARIDPEVAHSLAFRSLQAAVAIPLVRVVLGRFMAPGDPSLQVRALGLTFPSPLGVAAGLDKDATWFEGLGLLGFGFVEVGTVTALPQAGNAKPRIFRIPRERALLNKMGFPNRGAEAVARRLRGRPGRVVLGVNVGKSRVTPLADAGQDYRAAVERVAPLSDYVAINVSSPNTPGLREMQAVELLRPLLAEVRSGLEAAAVEIPLLVKIGPDASDALLDAIAELALELSLDGIVAVNTTVDRSALATSAATVAHIEGGGVSGAPLKARALEVLRRLHARVGDSLVLISVGGIEGPEDAWQRILAGATLVQAYTGFIYGGPLWPRRMNRDLARRVRKSGMPSIQDLVGAGSVRARDGGQGAQDAGRDSATRTSCAGRGRPAGTATL